MNLADFLERHFPATLRVAEPAATVASGILAEPVSGLVGLAGAPLVGAERAARAVQGTQDALTYSPRTQPGQAGLQGLAEFIAPVGEAMGAAEQGLGGAALEATGSPGVAAAAHSIPTALLEALAVGKVARAADKALMPSASGPAEPSFPQLGNSQRGAVGDIRPEEYRISATLGEDGLPEVTPGRTFSQRRPTAKGSETQFIDEHLDLNFEDWASSPAGAAAAEKLPDNPYLKIDKRYSTRGRLDQAVDQMLPRLESFVENADPALRESASHWYPAFNNLGDQIAQKHGIPTEQGAASIASLSPSTEWDANLEHALRLSHMLRNMGDLPIDNELRALLTEGDFAERFKKGRIYPAAMPEILNARTAGEVFSRNDPIQTAMLAAAIDRNYFPNTMGSWSPEGQLLGDALSKSGEPKKYKPNSINANSNAVRALTGDYADASAALGNAHKVRTFGLSGSVPDHPGAFTVDTHAAGAALGAPLGSGHPLIMQTFGQSEKGAPEAFRSKGLNRADSGYAGMFPLYHEVYDRAAKDAMARGVIPRENAMQSIPWEVKRQRFVSNDSTVRENKAIWDAYKKGQITNEQAIEMMWQLAR